MTELEEGKLKFRTYRWAEATMSRWFRWLAVGLQD